MIDRSFWEEARRAWIVQAPPKIKDVHIGSGGDIDPSLLVDPWDMDEIPFDMVDFEGATRAAFEGGEIPLKPGIGKSGQRQAARAASDLATETEGTSAVAGASSAPVEEKPKRPKLDSARFEAALEQQTLPAYVDACRLLRACALPQEMDALYGELIDRMSVLQDTMDKFEQIYQADTTQLREFYIPEALELTASYLEYLDIGIGEDTIESTAREILEALKKLRLAVEDTQKEICKFATIEINAKAKALESLMSQNGFVNPDFKIHEREDE